MKELIKQIQTLKKSQIRKTIDQRISEFKAFKNKPNSEWFSELCFCILTANSKAETALNIQKKLHTKGFMQSEKKDISKCIRENKHRFHNNKAKYICEARTYINIKPIIENITKNKKKEDEISAREFIVKNIKGLGYKEASHFLRNVGYQNLAILDRHIINLMLENKLIKEKPKTLNKPTYLKLEQTLDKLAKKLKLTQAELDLYMWYMKTGKVLK